MVRNSSSITISSPSREFELAGSRRRNVEEQPSISNSVEKSSRPVLLLDNQLTVHWEAVPGVTSYLVQLQIVGEKDSLVVWEQVSEETKAVYSGDPLEPGVEYELVVKPHDNQFSDSDTAAHLNVPRGAQGLETSFNSRRKPPAPGLLNSRHAPSEEAPEAALSRLRFMRLDEDVAQRVQEAEETLVKLDLPEASTALNQLYESLFVAASLSPADRAFCAKLYQIEPAWCCNYYRCFAYPPCRIGGR